MSTYTHLVATFEISEFQSGRRVQVVAKCGYRFTPVQFGSMFTKPACPECFYTPQFAIAA